MRVIEREMLTAIREGKEWRKDNTRVDQVESTGGADVYLYNHHIATVQANGVVLVNTGTLRNYPTVTTKSRLRALGVNVYTRKHITYLDGEEI